MPNETLPQTTDALVDLEEAEELTELVAALSVAEQAASNLANGLKVVAKCLKAVEKCLKAVAKATLPEEQENPRRRNIIDVIAKLKLALGELPPDFEERLSKLETKVRYMAPEQQVARFWWDLQLILEENVPPGVGGHDDVIMIFSGELDDDHPVAHPAGIASEEDGGS